MSTPKRILKSGRALDRDGEPQLTAMQIEALRRARSTGVLHYRTNGNTSRGLESRGLVQRRRDCEVVVYELTEAGMIAIDKIEAMLNAEEK